MQASAFPLLRHSGCDAMMYPHSILAIGDRNEEPVLRARLILSAQAWARRARIFAVSHGAAYRAARAAKIAARMAHRAFPDLRLTD